MENRFAFSCPAKSPWMFHSSPAVVLDAIYILIDGDLLACCGPTITDPSQTYSLCNDLGALRESQRPGGSAHQLHDKSRCRLGQCPAGVAKPVRRSKPGLKFAVQLRPGDFGSNRKVVEEPVNLYWIRLRVDHSGSPIMLMPCRRC